MLRRWLLAACCLWPLTARAHVLGLVEHADVPAAADANASTAPQPLTVEQCVQIALDSSAVIEESEAKVREFQARLAEVQSIFYPKLLATAFIAPMFRVTGSGYSPDFTEEWRSPKDWGPYTNLEMLLMQPIYTFGRAEAAGKAVRERTAVEQARVREARNAVALEVRKFYYGHLFAATILPTLNQAIKLLDDARSRAQELYDNATGDVTQVELAKLDYGRSEAARFRLMAEDGATLALAALRHTMGLPADVPLTLADRFLPAIPTDLNERPLADLMVQASNERPEWAQLEHGQQASLALEEAERLANWPVLFAAGQFRYAWTPMRDADNNPWHYDNYNVLIGGVAVGLRFELDPALAIAKGDAAKATGDQVEALRRFASTGIPLQVRRAHADLTRAKATVDVTNAGVMATRKWMSSAATAFSSGSGDARDLLEGLAAYVQAKRNYLESLNAYYVASAELAYAVGS